MMLCGQMMDEVLNPGEVGIPLRRDAELPAHVVGADVGAYTSAKHTTEVRFKAEIGGETLGSSLGFRRARHGRMKNSRQGAKLPPFKMRHRL